MSARLSLINPGLVDATKAMAAALKPATAAAARAAEVAEATGYAVCSPAATMAPASPLAQAFARWPKVLIDAGSGCAPLHAELLCLLPHAALVRSARLAWVSPASLRPLP